MKIINRNNGKKVVAVQENEAQTDERQTTQTSNSGNISGTVLDKSGLPLPGVNVIVKGTSTGTQTDFDGNYSINAVEGADLVFSFVGMQTLETTIGNSSIVNISMQEDSAQVSCQLLKTPRAACLKRRFSRVGIAWQAVLFM